MVSPSKRQALAPSEGDSQPRSPPRTDANGGTTQNRRARRHDGDDLENDGGRVHGDGGAPRQRSELQRWSWRVGIEPPPFTVDSSAAIAMVLDVANGTALNVPRVRISKAVAIQIYLLFQTPALIHLPFSLIYRALAALSRGVHPVRAPSYESVKRLRRMLHVKADSRNKKKASGLVATFQDRIWRRASDALLAGLDTSAAASHLLTLYDNDLLDFSFDDTHLSAPDGGGDPGGDPPIATEQLASGGGDGASAPLDIRTRTCAAALELLGAARRRRMLHMGMELSEWHRCGGELPDDALRVIDDYVRRVPLSRARRAETHELQAIRLREQVDSQLSQVEVDSQRRQLEAAEAEARASAREATRALRVRDAALDREASRAQAAAEAAEAARAQHVAELREHRAAAASKQSALRREATEARIARDEAVEQLEAEIISLRRELARAATAHRSVERDAAAAQGKLEADLQQAREGRVWSRVREEEARRQRAEEERDRLYAENEELQAELSSRSGSRAAEKDELYHLRYRVKELQAKVASYDVRSNRKFFEVEPLAEELQRLRAEIEAERAVAASYRAIAEPPAEYFFKGGFTLASDLAAAECLTKAHVSANQVPLLFIIFSRLFRIKAPTRIIKVPHKKVDGKMTYVEREVTYWPGKSHVKEIGATLNAAHKLQIGVQLLETPGVPYTYIADGAESMQSEWLSQLLSMRGPDGHLKCTALDLSLLHSKTSEAQAEAFKASLLSVAELLKAVGITDDVSPLLLAFSPDATMNDRAAPARKAARLVRGLLDMIDDPTCAHHAITNIFEAGRKAIDALLKVLMNISDEQAAGDASKVKAMRTHVGWFSSPACSLIFQTSKYVALFSSKGYAIGAKFRKWIEAELHLKKGELDDLLLGAVEDMQAICGSRDYVFFLDAAVTARFAQTGSLKTFLEDEADLGAEAGGKLRNSILLGMNNDYCMAAVHTMAILCDASLFQLLRAIGSDDHILDVLPEMWPKTLAFYEAAAAEPRRIINRSLKLELPCGQEARETERSRRAAIDMKRIYSEAMGNEIIEKMLAAAFKEMAAATRNHASEFVDEGPFVSSKITEEMRHRLSGTPMTSCGAERMFAVGRRFDARAGASHDHTRAGTVLGDIDNTTDFMHGRDATEGIDAEAEWRVFRKEARRARRETMRSKWLKVGLAERATRDEKLSAKRAKRTAKAAERARVEALPLVTRFSGLKELDNAALSDQLRKRKLLGAKGIVVTHPNRTAFVLALQALLLDADSGANDLPDDDSGVDGRNVKRKAKAPRGTGKKAGKAKKGLTEYMGYSWTEEEAEHFKVEAIVGKVEADGKTEYANQGKARKGTILYRIVWETYSADMLWYEPAKNIGKGLRDEYEATLEAEAAADLAAAQEEAELAEMEEEEAMPPP